MSMRMARRSSIQVISSLLRAGRSIPRLLLLRSANDKHPNGLANSSDMVGRHYMCHNNSAMLAISLEPNPTLFGKTFAINDFYLKDEDSSLPLGHIQMLGKSNGEMLKGDAPPFTPLRSLILWPSMLLIFG